MLLDFRRAGPGRGHPPARRPGGGIHRRYEAARRLVPAAFMAKTAMPPGPSVSARYCKTSTATCWPTWPKRTRRKGVTPTHLRRRGGAGGGPSGWENVYRQLMRYHYLAGRQGTGAQGVPHCAKLVRRAVRRGPHPADTAPL